MYQGKATYQEKFMGISDAGAGRQVSARIEVDEKPPAIISDDKLDEIIGNLLRIGVIVSSLVVLIGAALFLAKHGRTFSHFHPFTGEPESLRSVLGVVKYAASYSSLGIIQLGLLLMIATPILRVLFTLVSFIVLKDVTYIIITFIVLATLLLSLTGLQLWDIF